MNFFPRRRPCRHGMVLLEVMVALAIFIVVAFSLVMALNAAMDAGRSRNERDAARRGLGDQLALLHSARLQLGEKDAPDDGSGIKYHIVIEHESMKDQKNQPVNGIYRATITAKWGADADAEERSVTELLYQP